MRIMSEVDKKEESAYFDCLRWVSKDTKHDLFSYINGKKSQEIKHLHIHLFRNFLKPFQIHELLAGNYCKEEWLSHIYHKRSRLTASQWFTEKEIAFISEELHKAYNQGMSKGYIKGRESLQNYIQELQEAEKKGYRKCSNDMKTTAEGRYLIKTGQSVTWKDYRKRKLHKLLKK